MLPKFPFSLFDFKHIDKIEPLQKTLSSSAGNAIALTTIYEVKDHKFVLLLGMSITVTKTTGTALLAFIERKNKIAAALTFVDTLIQETADTGPYSWPSQKTAAEHTVGWHLCFMFPGDKIRVSQALTAAETILHEILIHRIEYSDPRFKE